MNNIVDSSAWIEYLKGNQMYRFIRELLCNNAICTNDVILAELLPTIIHRKENHLAELLNSLRKYEIFIDWLEIRSVQALNLKHGNNHIGISDIIIAQNCIQNDLKLLTNDKRFSAMAKYIPLKIYK